MTENKKDKNKNTKAILERSFDLYKKFLDNPSKRNLNAFMEVAENYKEAFIEDTSDFINTSSKDLNIENTFNEDVTMLPMRTVSYMSAPSIDRSTPEEKSISDFLMKLKKWEEGGRPLKDTQILNRLIAHNTSELIPIIQNTNSLRRDDILKNMPHRVSNYINKGPIKLFSNYVNISEPHFEATGIDIPADITFLEFRIAKYKYVLYTDDNTANQWVRPFPRRWYMEENKDQGRIPWFEDREEIQPIFREFNKWNPLVINGQDAHDFFKEHDSGSTEFYNSDDLNEKDREDIFREHSLNDSEYDFFINNNFKFLFCDSITRKNPKQILEYRKVTWRDICFFNDSQMTIRSFTNDMSFMPRCKDFITADPNKEFEQAVWVMSNEMPKLSYPVMRFFSKSLEKDFLDKPIFESGQNRKERIYDLFTNEDLNPEEIAAGLRLDPDYTEDILNSIIKEKKGELID
tara:strand:- start:542 stop:1924 length:1383 start_codon:yes stop_codon:yes gene_type:complete